MKQFQFVYNDDNDFVKELTKIRQWSKSKIYSNILFQIFSETTEEEKIRHITDIINREIPDALYFGCSSDGNIIEGDFADTEFVFSCTVFEYPTTKIEILQYHLTEGNHSEVVRDLVRQIDERPWVKAVEMLITLLKMSMAGFCKELDSMRRDVSFFGGGAFARGMNQDEACVFSSTAGYDSNGVNFMLIGGEDVYVSASFVAGWKPLGRDHIVTKSEGNNILELDGKPAYETYYRYLHIKNDEHFFYNTLEFPFLYKHNGLEILRAPVKSNPDGSLFMSGEVEENVNARIAYGDPWTILESVKDAGERIQKFAPEVIKVFSCVARRTFWGDNEVGKETLPLQSIAPTSGFYTSGEFLRTGDHVNLHNVTLVIAGLREGEGKTTTAFEMDDADFSGKVSMINRLATFIEAATEELEEANQKLRDIALKDGLTGLYNRMEIQRRISRLVKVTNGDAGTEQVSEWGLEPEDNIALIMIDLDDFKKVNDTYGHKEGDNVLTGFSRMVSEFMTDDVPDASVGRWGGEEFMILLPGFAIDEAVLKAEKIRENFAAIEFEDAGHQTLSAGVTAFKKGESPDMFTTRVDKALYDAKRSGKNKVMIM